MKFFREYDKNRYKIAPSDLKKCKLWLVAKYEQRWWLYSIITWFKCSLFNRKYEIYCSHNNKYFFFHVVSCVKKQTLMFTFFLLTTDCKYLCLCQFFSCCKIYQLILCIFDLLNEWLKSRCKKSMWFVIMETDLFIFMCLMWLPHDRNGH